MQKPTLFFFHGFKSSKHSSKATYFKSLLQDEAKVVLFDLAGHGDDESNFSRYTFADWVENCKEVFRTHHGDHNIIIGSSMGGWLALVLAQEPWFKERIQGLVLLASGQNFLQSLPLSDAALQELQETGICMHQSSLPEPYPVTQALINSGSHFQITPNHTQLSCPLHLVHGEQDDIVPLTSSQELFQQVQAPTISLTTVKDNHSLQAQTSLDLTALLIRNLYPKP